LLMDYRFTSKGATFNEIGQRLSQFFYVTPAGANAPHGQLLAAGMVAWAGLLILLSAWVVRLPPARPLSKAFVPPAALCAGVDVCIRKFAVAVVSDVARTGLLCSGTARTIRLI
jgi:hypothetical protein